MLGFMGIYLLGQELWFFPHSMSWLIGPFMYYYLKTQINSNYSFSWTDFWHFLPYVAYFIYHLIIFLAGPQTVEWWNAQVHTPLKIGMIESFGENISLIIYSVATLQLYRRYRLWLPTERSDTEVVSLRWYQHFIAIMILGVFISTLFFVAGMFTRLTYEQDWILRAIVAFIICYLGFSAFTQIQPRQLVFEEQKNLVVANEPGLHESGNLADDAQVASVSKERAAPRLDHEELSKWCNRLTGLMEAEKLYLDPELTLSELSRKMNTPSFLISNVINAGFRKNFNDWVNEYRVVAFQQKVSDPDLKHYTLLALAFECGFNSKSTFNRAVKKMTGQLPSEFLRAGQ